MASNKSWTTRMTNQIAQRSSQMEEQIISTSENYSSYVSIADEATEERLEALMFQCRKKLANLAHMDVSLAHNLKRVFEEIQELKAYNGHEEQGVLECEAKDALQPLGCGPTSSLGSSLTAHSSLRSEYASISCQCIQSAVDDRRLSTSSFMSYESDTDSGVSSLPRNLKFYTRSFSDKVRRI